MLNTEYNSKRLNAVSSLDSAILLLYDSITSQFSGAAVNVVRGGLPGWMYSAATRGICPAVDSIWMYNFHDLEID